MQLRAGRQSDRRGRIHVFAGQLPDGRFASEPIEPAHHAGIVRSIQVSLKPYFAEAHLRLRHMGHAIRGIANKIRHIRKRIGIAQPRQDAGPGKRPLRRDTVDDMRRRQYLDIRTKLGIADFGPGRCLGRYGRKNGDKQANGHEPMISAHHALLRTPNSQDAAILTDPAVHKKSERHILWVHVMVSRRTASETGNINNDVATRRQVQARHR
ncbi:MAG: hypothetical protein WDN01_01290 [Rhizomicrobium sp.]